MVNGQKPPPPRWKPLSLFTGDAKPKSEPQPFAPPLAESPLMLISFDSVPVASTNVAAIYDVTTTYYRTSALHQTVNVNSTSLSYILWPYSLLWNRDDIWRYDVRHVQMTSLDNTESWVIVLYWRHNNVLITSQWRHNYVETWHNIDVIIWRCFGVEGHCPRTRTKIS